MVDSQAKIRVDIDLAQALADLKLLEKQIQFFNKSIVFLIIYFVLPIILILF
jgi:hypothetical protein